MSYGSLDERQRRALRTIVEGRVVHDLGAGDLALAHELAKLGAAKVIAIDCYVHATPTDARVEFRRAWFQDVRDDIDVLFLSWPVNRIDPDVVRLVSKANVVAYLGKNTDGAACGSALLFQALVRRRLSAYVPHEKNSLIIRGGETIQRPSDIFRVAPRKATAEEAAGMLTCATAMPRDLPFHAGLVARWEAEAKRRGLSIDDFAKQCLAYREARAIMGEVRRDVSEKKPAARRSAA